METQLRQGHAQVEGATLACAQSQWMLRQVTFERQQAMAQAQAAASAAYQADARCADAVGRRMQDQACVQAAVYAALGAVREEHSREVAQLLRDAQAQLRRTATPALATPGMYPPG